MCCLRGCAAVQILDALGWLCACCASVCVCCLLRWRCLLFAFVVFIVDHRRHPSSSPASRLLVRCCDTGLVRWAVVEQTRLLVQSVTADGVIPLQHTKAKSTSETTIYLHRSHLLLPASRVSLVSLALCRALTDEETMRSSCHATSLTMELCPAMRVTSSPVRRS